MFGLEMGAGNSWLFTACPAFKLVFDFFNIIRLGYQNQKRSDGVLHGQTAFLR
ncbi:hypothetical protein CYPRO_1817 [Cyclonatronum proteinivorum]|uniref:Uncharacterized protein n=1 Tax=Cyclonatronum proteinivorum TaxID=1457365 RepID=A0A345UKR5_9BACT|nr:hypothetical protein CYPRO_1817 [Cyclonatronum proteinivorum]